MAISFSRHSAKKNQNCVWNQLFQIFVLCVQVRLTSSLHWIVVIASAVPNSDHSKNIEIVFDQLICANKRSVTYDDVLKRIFCLIDGIFFHFRNEKFFYGKRIRSDELCTCYSIATRAKKKLFDLSAWSPNDCFLFMTVSLSQFRFPIHVSNSRSINDYRCKSSRFKANIAIIMAIQIEPDLNTHMILLQFIPMWLKKETLNKNRSKKKQLNSKREGERDRRKKLIDFHAWIKTKLNTQCLKRIKNLFCTDKR